MITTVELDASAASRTSPVEPDRAIVERAAMWLSLLQSPEVDPEDRSAAQAWRAQDPRHELAWQRLQTLWSGFEPAAAVPARRALKAAWSLPQRRRRSRMAVLGCVLAIGATLIYGVTATDPWADERTSVAERRSLELPDGSRLLLNAASAVEVDYSERQRRIVLRRGDVLVDVAADAHRPFVVETAQGSARALGTRYLVSYDVKAALTQVTVLESSVRVCAAAEKQACVDLQPGQRSTIDARGVSAAQTGDAEAATAWQSGQLVVDDRPVAEVLAALKPYRRGRLAFDPAALDGIRVSGVFPLDDPEQALAVLERTLPVTVQRYTAWWVRVQPREH